MFSEEEKTCKIIDSWYVVDSSIWQVTSHFSQKLNFCIKSRKYYFRFIFTRGPISSRLYRTVATCSCTCRCTYIRPILHHSRTSPLRHRVDQIYLHQRIQGVCEPPRLCLVMPRRGRTSSIASRVNSLLRITRVPRVCARSTESDSVSLGYRD